MLEVRVSAGGGGELGLPWDGTCPTARETHPQGLPLPSGVVDRLSVC